MSSNSFVAGLARGAVASTIAASGLLPESYSMIVDAAVPPEEMSMPAQAFELTTSGQSADGDTVVRALAATPEEWTRRMERDFRKLASGEAQGKLTPSQVVELERLSAFRDRLVCPREAEEILVQLKRERLVERMSETLQDYVQFQETTGKQRPPTA